MSAQTDLKQLMDENTAARPMDLSSIQELVAEDMRAVDSVIRQRLQSDVVLINHLSYHIINSGGKRLRPLLLLLTAQTFGCQDTRRVELAAIIEFIHTATLLHDDVVDDSKLRRGQETANALWGNEASVLVGDFLYSRAFEMMVDVGSMHVMEILAKATNAIAEGEVLQLLNCNDAATTEERYLEVIHCKTARLFEAATRLGAVVSGCPEEQEMAMKAYGMHLGTAFQLIDDALDYQAHAQRDRQEHRRRPGGRQTHPAPDPRHPQRYAGAGRGHPPGHRARRPGKYRGGPARPLKPRARSRTLPAPRQQEVDKAAAALRVVPPSPYKDALHALTEFSVTRTY